MQRPQNPELPTDVIASLEKLYANEGAFGNFPHYHTFAEQGVSLIDLNRERVIALSNLTAWTMLESADYIAENLAF